MLKYNYNFLTNRYFFTIENDILCDLITMHKCHVFLTVVEKTIFCLCVVAIRLRNYLTNQDLSTICRF
jgi:hypothetical protein